MSKISTNLFLITHNDFSVNCTTIKFGRPNVALPTKCEVNTVTY